MSRSTGARLLAITSTSVRAALREKLGPLDLDLTCASSADEIRHLVEKGENFEVVLLPEKFSSTEWWPLWGELSNLDPLPAILVYSRNPTFRLWTAVLDLGGYGVISEPFEEREIVQVINDAAQQFRERARNSAT